MPPLQVNKLLVRFDQLVLYYQYQNHYYYNEARDSGCQQCKGFIEIYPSRRSLSSIISQCHCMQTQRRDYPCAILIVDQSRGDAAVATVLS